MQMLSQLSYRPVPRIIPNHGKPRQRTISGVTTTRILDRRAVRDVGIDPADKDILSFQQRPGGEVRCTLIRLGQARRASLPRADRPATMTAVLA